MAIIPHCGSLHHLLKQKSFPRCIETCHCPVYCSRLHSCCFAECNYVHNLLDSFLYFLVFMMLYFSKCLPKSLFVAKPSSFSHATLGSAEALHSSCSYSLTLPPCPISLAPSMFLFCEIRWVVLMPL